MMKGSWIKMFVLTMLFGILMSIPWLAAHCGFLVLFGFVPLLYMDYIADSRGVKRFWLWHYSAFVLWNAVTTFWVCNATVGGGVFAVLANAFQMSVIFALFRLSKSYFKGVLPYIFLAVMWIAWERAYFSADISWPWLVLGNAFARSTRMIQWYEYTGTLGGSLWVWACNLTVFGIAVSVAEGRFRRLNSWALTAVSAGSLLLFLAPPVLSGILYKSYEEVSEGKIDVLVAQPNIDPYNKFTALTQVQQDSILTDLLRGILSEKDTIAEPLLLLCPETFTSDVICGDYASSGTWRHIGAVLDEFPGTGAIFGATTREFTYSSDPPTPESRRVRDNFWLQVHNSALSLDASRHTEIYHKSRLVVGVEMTPYPALFTKIDDLLGGVMGRCVGQDEISLLHFNGVPLGCAICYESVYPEFCTGYVRKGAKALTVITNDAWWGDTPGYRQHLSYSCLRAIELRRDIARCGNTGISAFINQRGDIVSRTSWWVKDSLEGSVNLSGKMTFFASHGDVTGRVSTFLFLLLALALAVKLLTQNKKAAKK